MLGQLSQLRVTVGHHHCPHRPATTFAHLGKASRREGAKDRVARVRRRQLGGCVADQGFKWVRRVEGRSGKSGGAGLGCRGEMVRAGGTRWCMVCGTVSGAHACVRRLPSAYGPLIASRRKSPAARAPPASLGVLYRTRGRIPPRNVRPPSPATLPNGHTGSACRWACLHWACRGIPQASPSVAPPLSGAAPCFKTSASCQGCLLHLRLSRRRRSTARMSLPRSSARSTQAPL